MATGKEIYDLGVKHIGERYILGAFAPKNNSNWKGPWDCAEFVSWCIYQTSNKLYGCDNNNANPANADAYTGFFARDAKKIGQKISVQNAMRTKGAALLRIAASNAIGHIVISDGNGGTIEAHSTKRGVIKYTAQGRRWDTGILIPWIQYDTAPGVITIKPLPVVYRYKNPMMTGNVIKDIQRALNNLGFNTGGTDGKFGLKTLAAVRAFQTSKGILVDGEVGPQTMKSLGL